jgi:hypothetical protein
MVAAEKRYEAHQKAFKIWYDLYSVIHTNDEDENKLNIIKAARKFWIENALYLEKRTREDFYEAILIVSFYKFWMQVAHEEQDLENKRKEMKDYREKWNFFIKVNETIQIEVDLPPLKPSINIDEDGNKIDKNIN